MINAINYTIFMGSLLDFFKRLSRLWGILEIDRANAQREVPGCSSEGKGEFGEVPFGF